jgi:deoxyribonuclease-4
MEEFDREVGLDRLVAVHANDSKVDLGGGRDRHENIGQGFIGEDGFTTILSHPAFANLPLLLEVPGFEKNGPDRQNVDMLRVLRRKIGLPEPVRLETSA